MWFPPDLEVNKFCTQLWLSKNSLIEAGESAPCTWTAKPPDLGSIAGVSGGWGQWDMCACPAPTKPTWLSECFWWLCCLSHGCQPVSAGFRAAQGLLSPCCSGFSFPCSAAWAEHILQAAACPPAWHQPWTSPLQRLQGCSSAAAPGTVRVTMPGDKLSSWQGASPNQTHQTVLPARVKCSGLSFDILT